MLDHISYPNHFRAQIYFSGHQRVPVVKVEDYYHLAYLFGCKYSQYGV